MNTVTVTHGTETKLLPLGLHFGLPADVYHRDAALGSSDLRLLARNPFNFWWQSSLNPGWKPNEKETESLINGRALHKLVYEGNEAFKREFEIGPDQTGLSSGEKGASTRKANEAAAKIGKTCIRLEVWERIAVTAAMITRNPDLATVFQGGRSEVSFFFLINGIRCKCRWDYLKTSMPKAGPNAGKRITGIGDLKGIANQYEMDLEQACYNAIATYRYDAQIAHYLDALSLLGAAVSDGLIYGGHDSEWVKRAASWDLRAFQLIFHQTEGAPITHSMIFSPNNPIVESGRAVIHKGLERYAYCMEKFGSDNAWLLLDPAREAEVERMPMFWGRS
jgi:hypothetical protein